MIQTGDVPVVPMPETTSVSNFWDDLKGMGFDEAIATISNSLISFTFRLLIAIIVFYVGRFLIKKIYSAVFNVMLKRKVDASLTTFVMSLLRISLYFLLIIITIGIIGVETSSFIALFASAGVAVGMALSGTLQNFAGGVLILLLKPYKVGDYIEVQGFTGTVKSIQLFNTVINTVDNKAIIVPNGVLSTSSINNYSLEDYRRVDWEIGLSYGCDFEAAREYIIGMLIEDKRIVNQYIEDDIAYRAKEENVKNDPTSHFDKPVAIPLTKIDRAPFVGLKELGDSAIILTVRAWTHSSNYWGVYFDINQRMYKELPIHGFSFPFPQLDVHINSEEEQQ